MPCAAKVRALAGSTATGAALGRTLSGVVGRFCCACRRRPNHRRRREACLRRPSEVAGHLRGPFSSFVVVRDKREDKHRRKQHRPRVVDEGRQLPGRPIASKIAQFRDADRPVPAERAAAGRGRPARRNWKRWGPTSPSGSGARCARTTRPTATPGTTSRTTTRAAAPTAGARTACSASATARPLCFALALWNGARPDPEGAAVRPDRPGGQPRRGRQGVYFYLDATPTHSYIARALQVPAARVSVRAARRRERPPRGATSPSTSSPTPASSTTTATSTSWPSTPRPGPTTS